LKGPTRAGARILGGEEGLNTLIEVFLLYAQSRILNGDYHIGFLLLHPRLRVPSPFIAWTAFTMRFRNTC
jgi:hypothetical protein